ncbi:MAG: hypothetical protein GXO90_07405 [FCB group bacterium]|nr:hypothetical protein [FCB group bacterium]
MGKTSLILLICSAFLFGQESDQKTLTPQQVQTAYYSMRYGDVIQMVKSELETHPTQSPEDLSVYLKYLAMALFAEEGESAARGALASLLLVDPAFTFSADEASPKIRALLEALRSENPEFVPESNPAPTYITLQDQRSSNLLASMILPGWGHLKRHERRGYVYSAAFLLSVGGALVFTGTTSTAHNAYLKAYDPADIQETYTLYNRNYKLRNNLLIASAVTYLASLLDLYFTAD